MQSAIQFRFAKGWRFLCSQSNYNPYIRVADFPFKASLRSFCDSLFFKASLRSVCDSLFWFGCSVWRGFVIHPWCTTAAQSMIGCNGFNACVGKYLSWVIFVYVFYQIDNWVSRLKYLTLFCMIGFHNPLSYKINTRTTNGLNNKGLRVPILF